MKKKKEYEIIAEFFYKKASDRITQGEDMIDCGEGAQVQLRRIILLNI